MSKQEGEEMARKNGMMFIETSAKNKVGVYEAFEELVNKIVESPMIKEVCLEERRKKMSDLGGTRTLGEVNDRKDGGGGCAYGCM